MSNTHPAHHIDPDSIVRGTPEHVGVHVNDFFAGLGLGRPVRADHHHGHITAIVVDNEIRGAAYAATATSIADALLLSGVGMRAFEVATQFQALEMLAVLPQYRGTGIGSTLLKSIAAHAKRDFEAHYLLARIEENSVGLQHWYAQRRFRLCAPNDSLVVDGVPLPKSDGYVEAWRTLAGEPGAASVKVLL